MTCLKRLKSEFPHLNFGGPAFAGCPTEYTKELLAACRTADVAPDFMSWHYYGQNPKDLIAQPARVRKLLDEAGFPKCKTIINEWHYLVTWDGIHGASSQDKIRKAHSGPSAHNGIDSAAFNLAVLAGFQNTCLDQSYYYGSGCRGNWGYKDGMGRFNKSYWSLKIFGDIVSGYADKVAAATTAARSRSRRQSRAWTVRAWSPRTCSTTRATWNPLPWSGRTARSSCHARTRTRPRSS